jgi:predicted transport protein
MSVSLAPTSSLLTTLTALRDRLPEFRAHRLNRVSTRRLWIDPMLDALGWSVENPARVQLAASLGGAVGAEYVLRLQGQPLVALDALALDETLPSGAARLSRCRSLATVGVPWFIQTNGATWKVYSTLHPTVLLIEGSVAMKGRGEPLEVVAASLAPLEREAVIRGSLTAILNEYLTPGRPQADVQAPSPLALVTPPDDAATARRGRGAPRALVKPTVEEQSHLAGVSDEMQAVYLAVRRAALAQRATGIRVTPQARYIGFRIAEMLFATVAVRRQAVKVWLPIDPGSTLPLPRFARDVRGIGHTGSGDLELTLTTLAEVDAARPFLTRAFQARAAQSQAPAQRPRVRRA